MKPLALALVLAGALAQEDAKVTEKLRFPSGDEITISADLYLASEDPETPFLVLFHQAGSSRGEYREIAPRLRELGYNCMAVDLRSGATMAGVKNGTARAAQRQYTKQADYLEAEQDMVAALEYARENHAKGELVAWGSSYSASLVLHLAGTQPELADAVLAFSPGEYFGKLGKPATWIQESAAGIRCPVFVTSARAEKDDWAPLFAAIPGEDKVGFVPRAKGRHGSRALWADTEGHEEYWKAVGAFLGARFPVPARAASED